MWYRSKKAASRAESTSTSIHPPQRNSSAPRFVLALHSCFPTTPSTHSTQSCSLASSRTPGNTNAITPCNAHWLFPPSRLRRTNLFIQHSFYSSTSMSEWSYWGWSGASACADSGNNGLHAHLLGSQLVAKPDLIP